MKKLNPNDLVISKIVFVAKHISFYKKIKTNETLEFKIFENAVKTITKEKGIRKEDFKFYAKNLEPILLKVNVKKILENFDYQQHIVFNIARTISITKAYENAGKQSFYVKKEFIDILKNTDFPEDVPVEQFVLPYSTFFLHFEGFSIPIEIGGLKIQDFLVSHKIENDKLILQIIFIEQTNPEEYIKQKTNVKESYSFSHIVIEENLQNTIKDLEQLIIKNFKILFDPSSFDENEKKVFDKNTINSLQEKYTEITRVFINLILYLNYIKEDIKEISNVPEKLIKRKEYYEKEGNQKKLEKVEKELKNYTRLYLVGKQTAKEIKAQSENIAKSKKRPHWRRGHIRRFKSDRFKKEWTFVRPTLIGKNQQNQDEERTYLVK